MGFLKQDGTSRLEPATDDAAFVGRLVGVRRNHPTYVPSGKGGTSVDTAFGQAIEKIAQRKSKDTGPGSAQARQLAM